MFDCCVDSQRSGSKSFETFRVHLCWHTTFCPKKNKKGNRLFTPEDLENLKVIFHLVKEKGYTLQGAKEAMKGGSKEIKETQKVIDSLATLKAFLLEIKDNL